MADTKVETFRRHLATLSSAGAREARDGKRPKSAGSLVSRKVVFREHNPGSFDVGVHARIADSTGAPSAETALDELGSGLEPKAATRPASSGGCSLGGPDHSSKSDRNHAAPAGTLLEKLAAVLDQRTASKPTPSADSRISVSDHGPTAGCVCTSSGDSVPDQPAPGPEQRTAARPAPSAGYGSGVLDHGLSRHTPADTATLHQYVTDQEQDRSSRPGCRPRGYDPSSSPGCTRGPPTDTVLDKLASVSEQRTITSTSHCSGPPELASSKSPCLAVGGPNESCPVLAPADPTEPQAGGVLPPASSPWWVLSLKRELLDAFREEFQAINKAVVEIKREIEQGATSMCTSLSTDITKVSDALNRSQRDLTEIIGEVLNLKKDIHPSSVVAAIREDMIEKLQDTGDTTGANMPSSSPCAIHNDNTALILDAVRKIRTEVDFAPVISAIKESRPQMEASAISQHVGASHTEVDLSGVLEEIQRSRTEVDFSQVLEAITVSNSKSHGDLTAVTEELRALRVTLDSTSIPEALACIQTCTDQTQVDEKLAALREEVRALRTVLESASIPEGPGCISREAGKRQPDVDLGALEEEVRAMRAILDSASIQEKLACIQTQVGLLAEENKANALAILEQLERASAGAAVSAGSSGPGALQKGTVDPARTDASKAPDASALETTARPGGPDDAEMKRFRDNRADPDLGGMKVARQDEASMESKKKLCIRAKTTGLDLPDSNSLQLEHQVLKTDLHNVRWELQRLEALMEKKMADHTEFIESLTRSSARSVLSEACSLEEATFLSKGHYGYVLACKRRGSGEHVVAKVISERWARVAVNEWAHGSEAQRHPHIVNYLEALMHRDTNGDMRRRIAAAFDSGVLPGKCPDSLPACYFCFILEFMDQGSAQQLAARGLLTLEGSAAILRQVASALAFMHKKRRTHNDVKPANILLQTSQNGKFLVVKLADLGLAEHSTDRARDHDLLAYTIWCLTLGEAFCQCPSHDGRDASIRQLRSSALVKKGGPLGGTLVRIVRDLWQGKLELSEVDTLGELQGLEVWVEGKRCSFTAAGG